jgi:hypothetical protein
MDLGERLRSGSNSDWKDETMHLCWRLKSALPTFRGLLLEQILSLLKQHRNDDRLLDSTEPGALNLIWDSAAHEPVPSNLVVSARCMGFLVNMAKGLPMPENVPFRLTQNMIDGMGILKTNGTSCSE